MNYVVLIAAEASVHGSAAGRQVWPLLSADWPLARRWELYGAVLHAPARRSVAVNTVANCGRAALARLTVSAAPGRPHRAPPPVDAWPLHSVFTAAGVSGAKSSAPLINWWPVNTVQFDYRGADAVSELAGGRCRPVKPHLLFVPSQQPAGRWPAPPCLH